MSVERCPYPFVVTFNQMLTCIILANTLRLVSPSCFPALERIKVTPKFCLKFLPIGVPFMLSVVCANWAYKYLPVSFLQIMKQSNIVTIYVFSVIAGLERLRWCSVSLLLVVVSGAVLAVEGELHFVLRGFLLQLSSSLAEAVKVVAQSVLMSGETRLDPLTMVLFMAPACFLANLGPCAIIDGPHIGTVLARLGEFWPVVLANVLLAFVLNIAVAQCIKELSAVGFLLCGVVKDTCIIVLSAWLWNESLTELQGVGFSLALAGVVMYSVYKQHPGCFEDDHLAYGFQKVIKFTWSGEAPK